MSFGTVQADLIGNSNGQTGNAIGPGFKNRLINGSFAVAQRGTSFASGANNDDAYTLDRWYILSDDNDVIDVTQETSTVPTNGQFAIALDVETEDKKFGIAQIIENKNCIGAIGNTVTVSFKAKVSATTKLDNVKCAIVAWSGTADTVTSDIISAWGAEGTNPTLIANATYENTPANLNVTTSYATYSVSGAVDTASTKNIIVFIWSDVTDTTAGDFLFITDVQLEVGPSATSFDNRSCGTELSLCQRYFQKIVDGAVDSSTTYAYACADSATSVIGFIKYNQIMRTAPTAVITAASFRANFGTVNQNSTTAPTLSNPGNAQSRIDQPGFSGLTTNGSGILRLNNDNGYFGLSAEL